MSDDAYMTVSESALAVVRACTKCDFFDVRRKYPRGGRGAGFREGNKQRGRLIQHFKAAHPEDYASLRDDENGAVER